MKALLRLCAWLLPLAAAAPARAHDALPIALALNQSGPQDYVLRARFPPAIVQGMAPGLDVAPPCRAIGRQPAALHIACPRGVPPPALLLTWRGQAGSAPVLLRLSYRDGQRRTLVAPAGTRRIDLPARQTPAGVFGAYFRTGLDHILGGADHLLFLVCLVLIAGRPGRIAWTVTGFTLGHAVTISLATLGLVMVDPGSVEVLIALSIVFAAAEIARGRTGSLTWRKPALVAALFGLLHGLGFAGALRETGLPQGEVPWALAAFNLGIEAGQLAFVIAVAAAFALARALLARGGERWAIPLSRPELAAWPIGLLASLWFFARLHAL